MNVLVAGGAKEFVFGTVQRNLQNNGVKIGWYVSEKDSKSYTGIPKGCEGVLIMRDGISHSLSGKVVADANKLGLPNACIDRQWSRSEGILRMQGFLGTPEPKAVTVAVAAAPVVTQKVTFDVAVQYLTEARQTGRVASHKEVLNKMVALLGKDAELSYADYQLALARACEAHPIVQKPKAVVAPVVEAKDPVVEAKSAVRILLEDNFDRLAITDFSDVVDLARKEFPQLADAITLPVVLSVVGDLRTLWSEHPQALKSDLAKWLVQRYRQFQKDGTGWPAWSRHEERKQIFGKSFSFSDWDCASSARGYVFGEWADDKLCSLKTAFAFFQTLCPYVEITEEDFQKLVKQGCVKGFHLPNTGWQTTRSAVQKYVDAEYPLGQKAAPKVPEVVVNPDPVPVVTPVKGPETDLYAMADLLEMGIGKKISQAQEETETKIAGVQTTLDEVSGTVEALKESTAKVVQEAAKEVTDKVQHFLSGAKVTLADSDRVVILQLVQKALEPVSEVTRHVAGQVATMVRANEAVSQTVREVQQSQQGIAEGLSNLQVQMASGFGALAAAIAGLKTDTPVMAPVASSDEAALSLGRTLLGAKGAEVRIIIGEVQPKG